MFTTVKILWKNCIMEAVLLAELTMETTEYECIKRLFRQKIVINKHDTDLALVFIPYVDRIKEVELIRKDLILTEFNLDFPEINNVNLIIKKFKGYEFLLQQDLPLESLYYEHPNDLLEILYKNLPELLNMKSTIIRPENNLFMEFKTKSNNECLEFCFRKNSPLFRKISHYNSDSIYLKMSDLESFWDLYNEYFDNPISPDKSNTFCFYGMNYYSKEMANNIFNKLKHYNSCDYILLQFLFEAFTYFNGFYILGI